MKIKYVLLILLLNIIVIPSVLADSSHFEATINMEPEITDNNINIILGFRGEEVKEISEVITYDSTKITLLDIVAADDFKVTQSSSKVDGKWHTIKILAESANSFNDTNYAVCIFQVKNNFKINKTNDLFFYNVEALSPENNKYRYRGDFITLTRTSKSEMYFRIEPINDSTKFKYFLTKYILIIAIVLLLVVVIIIVIVLHLPTRRKIENRKEQVSAAIKCENYQTKANDQQFKINLDEIDKIGAKDKVIDLNDAIIESDIKPFEDNPEKNDIVRGDTNTNESINVPFDPFSITPEDLASTNVKEIELPRVNKEKEPLETPKVKTSKILENDNGFKDPIITVDIAPDDVEIIDNDDNDTKNT